MCFNVFSPRSAAPSSVLTAESVHVSGGAGDAGAGHDWIWRCVLARLGVGAEAIWCMGLGFEN